MSRADKESLSDGELAHSPAPARVVVVAQEPLGVIIKAVGERAGFEVTLVNIDRLSDELTQEGQFGIPTVARPVVTIIERPHATLGLLLHTVGSDGPDSPLNLWWLMTCPGEVRLPRPVTVEFLVGILNLMLGLPSTPHLKVCNATVELFEQSGIGSMPPDQSELIATLINLIEQHGQTQRPTTLREQIENLHGYGTWLRDVPYNIITPGQLHRAGAGIIRVSLRVLAQVVALARLNQQSAELFGTVAASELLSELLAEPLVPDPSPPLTG